MIAITRDSDAGRLSQAVYTEDISYVLKYGKTIHDGILACRDNILSKVSDGSIFYKVEIDTILSGFFLVKNGSVSEYFIRKSKSADSDKVVYAIKSFIAGDLYQANQVFEKDIAVKIIGKELATGNYQPIEFNMVNNMLMYRFAWSDKWNTAGTLTVPNAKQIEMRHFSGYVQWRYANGDWVNLYPVSVVTAEGDEFITITAAETIPSYYPVAVIDGVAYQMDSSNIDHINSFVGFSINSPSVGQPCSIKSDGVIEHPGWGLLSGETYLAKDGGGITNLVTLGMVFKKIIGTAISGDKMVIKKETISIKT